MSRKNSNDTVRNATRDLPACCAVPQPTAPPRVPAVTARGFVKFYVRDSYQIPNLVKIEKNIYENLHAGLRAHCIVEGSEKYFVARQHCKGNPLLLFRGNTQQLYIIGICNNEKETHYCVTVATLVTRKCQIFT